MELLLPKEPCPLACVVFYHAQRAMKNLKQTWSDVEKVTLKAGEETIVGEVDIAKYLCTKLNLPIYPEPHRAEIDKILSEYPSYNPHDLQVYLAYRTYLVGHTCTVADIAVYTQLPGFPPAFFRVQRWVNLMSSDPFIKRFQFGFCFVPLSALLFRPCVITNFFIQGAHVSCDSITFLFQFMQFHDVSFTR